MLFCLIFKSTATFIWVPSLDFQKKKEDCKCMSLGEKRNPNVADIICYTNYRDNFKVKKYMEYMFKEKTKFTEGKLNYIWLYIAYSFISLLISMGFGSLLLITKSVAFLGFIDFWQMESWLYWFNILKPKILQM